eukprot:CAMPEP_0171132674 /NCGR_PEP_ID=MMETSP0766_2-20121228/124990_1 /TAXON_ID=439317 /ORGANISM="Gambierdiscus australes, Strain CAWD 149" /LENGTH=55 /DNA_ID=CAMNT_0011596025 /DNA_START=203 /DNA_END=366 /DNA_ORIENTATION=-
MADHEFHICVEHAAVWHFPQPALLSVVAQEHGIPIPGQLLQDPRNRLIQPRPDFT